MPWQPHATVPPEDGRYLVRISSPIGNFIRPAIWSSERQVWRDPEDQIDFESIDSRLRILAWFEPAKK